VLDLVEVVFSAGGEEGLVDDYGFGGAQGVVFERRGRNAGGGGGFLGSDEAGASGLDGSGEGRGCNVGGVVGGGKGCGWVRVVIGFLW
jgi:hypothetical protein